VLKELTVEFLERDLATLDQAALEEFRITKLIREDVNLFVWFLSRPVEGTPHPYLLLLDATDYPERSMQGSFLNPETRESGLNWWPKDYAGTSIFRSANTPQFICAPAFRTWETVGNHGRPASPDEWKLHRALEAVWLGLNAPAYQGYHA
jgi:hypothetical protein